MTLREQVRDAINDVFRHMNCRGLVPTRAASAQAADAVLVVFAERERLLRERIEALSRFDGGGLLRSNGAWISRRDVLGVFDDES